MKKSKKKGGFTLVEIIIAFAIFSIMAVMIVQVLNLTLNRRKSNDEFQKNLAEQEQNLYAKPKDTTYDSAASADGQLDLTFHDPSGDTSMTINYQYKNANDSVADVKAGINYFTGNLDYDGTIGDTTYTPGSNTSNPEDIQGSIMNRYDARIIGTKGLTSIKIDSVSGGTVNADGTADYTVSVSINNNNVDSDYKNFSQISLFFGKPETGENARKVKTVTSPSYDKYIKKTGLNGVNIHCGSGGTFSNPIVFTVKLSKPLESGFNENSFGDGITNGTYTKVDGTENVYGAYPLNPPSTSTPTTPGGESS